jgi:cellobiose-specific phosphotransferase system component IIA
MEIAQRNPESSARSFGQTIGSIAAPAALSAYSGQFAVPAAEAAASSMGLSAAGNPISMMIARALGAGAGGAAEGYITGNEENRSGSALMGGLSAGAFQAGSDLLKARSSSIAKNVENTVNDLKTSYGNQFESVLESGENAGANKFLKPMNEATIDAIKDSKYTKLSNSLTEYNKSPTLKNAHKAQSDLNKIARMADGSANKIGEEAIKAQNHLMVQIGEAFEKSGAKDALNGYEALRKEYAKNVVPYIDSKAVKALINKELRPHKFAGEILKEENFLAKLGQNHPDLMLRESLADIGNSRLGQAVIGAGSLAAAQASGLPYHIQKYFK